MNARTNPFASRYVESIAFQCPGLSFEEIMARLKKLNYRAAIIGPEGSGKTTLLETIGKRLQQTGFKTIYVRLNEENKKLKKDLFNHNPKTRIIDHAFLVDGAEQLTWMAWKLFCLHIKNAGAVIITSHAETRRIRMMPTLLNTTTCPDLLYDLVFKLIGKKDMVSRQEITRLFNCHHGNIRLALRELYDIWADK
jgi:predicted ATP-binding protein involved in virulence